MKAILVAIVLAATAASADEIRPSNQTVKVQEFKEWRKGIRVLDGQDMNIVIDWSDGKRVVYHDVGADGTLNYVTLRDIDSRNERKDIMREAKKTYAIYLKQYQDSLKQQE